MANLNLEDYMLPDEEPERLDAFGIYGENKELTAEEQARVASYLEDLRAVLTSPAGFRVLLVLMERMHQFEPIYTGNSTTFYNLGKHEAGRGLLMELAMADIETFKLFHAEMVKRWARNFAAGQTRKK